MSDDDLEDRTKAHGKEVGLHAEACDLHAFLEEDVCDYDGPDETFIHTASAVSGSDYNSTLSCQRIRLFFLLLSK